jgi:hypothetical protein
MHNPGTSNNNEKGGEAAIKGSMDEDERIMGFSRHHLP